VPASAFFGRDGGGSVMLDCITVASATTLSPENLTTLPLPAAAFRRVSAVIVAGAQRLRSAGQKRPYRALVTPPERRASIKPGAVHRRWLSISARARPVDNAHSEGGTGIRCALVSPEPPSGVRARAVDLSRSVSAGGTHGGAACASPGAPAERCSVCWFGAVVSGAYQPS
jgi:hypothetical protein